MTDDAYFMFLALQQSELAGRIGEVPVGAVIVKDCEVIAAAHNAPITTHDPTAHAEMRVLRAASATLGNYRLQGCDLFVTLEPCVMCAGAILQARLRRIVFGAWEPKTGAAGSVLNLFENNKLNHQTQVLGGVLHAQCAHMLKDFFLAKRAALSWGENKVSLRQDALRTPEFCFKNLPECSWSSHYVHDLPRLAGLRMHYFEEGCRDSAYVFLCLHGNMDWSYSYNKMSAVWCAAGHRVVVPDLIGFGKSDKPKKEKDHTLEFHQNSLLQLVERLGLRNVVLVLQESFLDIGLALTTAAPERFRKVMSFRMQVNPELARICAFPFPDNGHKAALRAFQELPVQEACVHSQFALSKPETLGVCAMHAFGMVDYANSGSVAKQVLALLDD